MYKKMGEKIEQISEKGILILSGLLFLVLSLYSLFFTTAYTTTHEELPKEQPDLFFLVLAVCVLLLCLLSKIADILLKKEENRKRNLRFLLTGVLIYTLSFCVIWVLISHCEPVGDQRYLSDAAWEFTEGNFRVFTENSDTRYLYIHPHQLGYAAFLELVYTLFGGGNYLAAQLLNAGFAVLCVFAGYQITALLFADDRISIYYLLLSMGCFPLFFYTAFVYGEVSSTALCMCAVWLLVDYLKKGRKWSMALSAVSIAAAVLIRNNSLIVLIAMALVLLIKGISGKNFRLLLCLLFLLAAVFGSRAGLRKIYEVRADLSMNRGAPMLLYVAMGMQEAPASAGWSNAYILHNYWGEADFDYDLSTEIAKADIRKSLEGFQADPLYMLDFYKRKFVSQWNDPTYQCILMTNANDRARGSLANSVYDGKLFYLLNFFMNHYQSLLFLSAFAWILRGWKEKRGIEAWILLIGIFGGFLFHMIWEAKGRYILPYFVLLLPVAAAGIKSLTDWKGLFTRCRKRFLGGKHESMD